MKIKSDAAHRVLMAAIATLLEDDPDPDSFEGRWLEQLSLLVEEYETRRWPIKPPSKKDQEQFRREQKGGGEAE